MEAWVRPTTLGGWRTVALKEAPGGWRTRVTLRRAGPRPGDFIDSGIGNGYIREHRDHDSRR